MRATQQDKGKGVQQATQPPAGGERKDKEKEKEKEPLASAFPTKQRENQAPDIREGVILDGEARQDAVPSNLRLSASGGTQSAVTKPFNHAELFEAYNELQRLAREYAIQIPSPFISFHATPFLYQCLVNSFETTFEAPEIIVVGTQSAGKSSLIEALVGFRFNYVGTQRIRPRIERSIRANLTFLFVSRHRT